MIGLRTTLSVILIFCFSIFTQAQLSLSALKNAGIKSEQDLLNLGVSKSEINKLKSEFKTDQSSNIQSSNIQVDTSRIRGEVINEPVVSVKQNDSPVNTLSELYGSNIFKKAFINLKENSDRIVPPSNYKLGSGDRISITIWGTSEFSNEFTLDQFGNISPNKVGRINLKGKSFSNAQKIIRSRFSNFYNFNSSNIAIDLTFSKIIAINVVGEVNAPGTYSVPSINSAFNILSLAGGVNKLGTLRDIEIIRNGEQVATLDVYQFLTNPKKFTHTYLQDGDFIVVRPAAGYVNVTGEVIRPSKYEIKEGESLIDVLKFAGDLTPYADKETINITQIKNNALQFSSLSLDFAKTNKVLVHFGDKINVQRIQSLIHNIVEIKGSVNVPGFYKFNKGDKILTLINSASGLNYNAYKQIAQITRVKENLEKEVITINLDQAIKNPKGTENTLLKEFDIIQIFNKNAFLIAKDIVVSGMVQNPGSVEYLSGMQLKSLITQTGGLKLQADLDKIQIERLSFSKDSASSYIETLNLKYPQNADFVLQAYDHVNFRRLPEFNFHQTITIKGEVKYPGIYSLNGKDETLSDLVERAGGLTNWAFLDGSSLLRSEDSLGLLLMDLADAVKSDASKFNYILKPGDLITIPKTNDIVSITGAIGFQSINVEKPIVNSPFHNGKRASFYIKKYGGGYHSNAKRKKVYVVSYSGHVKKSRFFGLTKPIINKGDKIIVEFKVKKEKREKGNPVNWNSVIESTTTKLTGILTLFILANSVFGN